MHFIKHIEDVGLAKAEEVDEGDLVSEKEVFKILKGEKMPEICRFFGIIIRIYAEPASQHHNPHFHCYYQSHAAVYDIDSLEIIAGSLPRR